MAKVSNLSLKMRRRQHQSRIKPVSGWCNRNTIKALLNRSPMKHRREYENNTKQTPVVEAATPVTKSINRNICEYKMMSRKARCPHYKPYLKTAKSLSSLYELKWKDIDAPIINHTWRQQHHHQIHVSCDEETAVYPSQVVPEDGNKPIINLDVLITHNTATSPSNPNQLWGRRQWRSHHKLYLKIRIFSIKPKSTLTNKAVTSPSQTTSEDRTLFHQTQISFDE